MAISYNKLWKLLIDLKMNRSDLREIAHLSTNVLAKMGRDESVAIENLERICLALNCSICDIVEIVCNTEEF